MLTQLSRASCARSVVAAAVRSAKPAVQVRAFVVPTIARRADFVQELYLQGLKSYKTPAVKESDAEGHVQIFSVPKTPVSPEETDLAGSLKEYESMAVEIEGQDSSAGQGAAVVPDWLEAEEDEPHAH